MAIIGRRMGRGRQTLAEKKFKKINFFGVKHHGSCGQIDIRYIVNYGTCIFGIIFQLDHSYPMFWVNFATNCSPTYTPSLIMITFDDFQTVRLHCNNGQLCSYDDLATSHSYNGRRAEYEALQVFWQVLAIVCRYAECSH